ncbi:lysylphosphatidylglycerol synthase domain-containing protein [Phyllobacterium sp. K27]
MTWRKRVVKLSVTVAILLSLFLIYRSINRYSLDEIVQSLGGIPFQHLIPAVGFAATSYACLTGFDALGLRYARKPLPYARVALTSFVSLSIGHNIGLSALSSGAIRYRFYSRWGLDAQDVAKVVLFSGLTVALGLLTLCAVSMLASPLSAVEITGIAHRWIMAVGLTIAASLVIFVFLCAKLRRPVMIWRWQFELPTMRLAITQIVLGTLNFSLIAASLHQLILAFQDVSYWDVSTVYAIANGAAIASHVPGGLGVLEATTQFLLPQAATIGAVIAFRVIYFFLPLPFGLLLFAAAERSFKNRALKSGIEKRAQASEYIEADETVLRGRTTR